MEKNEDIVYAIKTEEFTLYNPTSSINVLSKDYASYCLLLAEHIDIAGFNQSSKYSIPGYTG